jgi:cyclophilin family peptidyl-prolyl cis-trans isomerase
MIQKSKIRYIMLAISFISIAGMIMLIGCGGAKQTSKQVTQTTPESTKTPTDTMANMQKQESTPKTTEGKYMVISVKIGEKALGKIKIELYPKEAPKTVANMIKLVNQGFYNGLTFHRVIAGFMIQGGDPKGDGTGGPDYTIPAEFSPKLTHIRGAVAMARTDNPTKASSSCQFYICHGEPHFLDNNYTIFGQVVEGMDVVDQIAGVKKDARDKPLTPVVMDKVTITD